VTTDAELMIASVAIVALVLTFFGAKP